MSWEATAWARRAMKKLGSEVKPVHRLLLVLLGDTADQEGVSWPSVKTLASECGCSERSIQRNIDKLVSLGLIEKLERRSMTGRQQSNLYRLNLDANLAEMMVPGEGDNSSPLPRQNDTPYPAPCEGDNLTPIGVTKCLGEGDKAVSPLEQPCEPTTHSLTASTQDFSPQPEPPPAPPPRSANLETQPMTPDWEPQVSTLVPALARSAIPIPVAEALAQDPELVNAFRNHQLANPGREYSPTGWTTRLATWLQRDWQRLGRPLTITDYQTARGFNHAAGSRTSNRDEVHAAVGNWQDTSWADGLY
ncbi:Helix-turn-helix domain-containing protein [Marinospirillum celere]|uniref:Helix-turn-helix domain-containing protein n=1 Tax=Marinospirillum celere TaxID=1122252 RepID=A0A1I1E126_9GAMM|nr:helix-turn-helix domain-containing protein [Marinospirillum celere]SFB80362.1 Helix-turn-helix domain-containing protein [Marinospirillum celere]